MEQTEVRARARFGLLELGEEGEAADSLCLAIERTVIRQSGTAIRALEQLQAALAAWETQ